MNISTDFSVWISAFLTLSIFSLLFKENPFYKFAEALFIGVSAGYIFCVFCFDVIDGKLIQNIIAGKWWYLIALILGVMLLFNNSKRFSFPAKYTALFFIGIFAGLNIVGYIKTHILAQIYASFQSFILFNKDGSINFYDSINAIVTTLGIATVSIYFLNTRKNSGISNKISNIGLVYLMIAFGSVFGYTLSSRITLLIGRINFVFSDWLGIIK